MQISLDRPFRVGKGKLPLYVEISIMGVQVQVRANGNIGRIAAFLRKENPAWSCQDLADELNRLVPWAKATARSVASQCCRFKI